MPHVHLLGRAQTKRPLETVDAAVEFLRRAVALADMKIIGGPWGVMGIVPNNEGPSAVAILDFSSTTLHSWPDAEPWPLIMFDLYSCKPFPDVSVFPALFEAYEPMDLRIKVIDRDAI